jgi:chitodextrinase
MSIKRKVISTTLSFSLLFSSFAVAPLSLIESFKSFGIYGDANAVVYTADEPIPQVVVDKMNSVASKFLPEDVAKIEAAQSAMANLSDVNVVLNNVWVNIEKKIALSPDPSEYNLLTPVSILKLMRESALMTYADPSGIEALRVHPEHRPVMDQLGKLGSPDPDNPIDLVPNDFVDFFYAVEKKVIEDAMANLDVQAMKTLIKGKVRLVVEDNTYKLSQIFNNIGITFTQLEDMKNRIHDAVDPNWEGYKGVSFAYARDGLSIDKTYTGYTTFFNPKFKIYDFTLPSSIPAFKWTKVSGDTGVDVTSNGSVSIPLDAAQGATYTAVLKMDVTYTDKYGSASKELFSEEMTFTYLGMDTESPTAPANLKTTDITKTTLTLDWEASTDNTAVFGYKIYVDGVYFADAEDSPFTLSDLTPGKEYVIKVTAIDASDNESDFSNEITVKTSSNIANDSPYNLKASSLTESQFQFDATPGIDSSFVKEYWIYKDGEKVAETSNLPFVVTGLEKDKVYSFTILTVDIDGGLSNISESLIVSTDLTKPSAPLNLKAEDVSNTSAKLVVGTNGTDNVAVKEYEIYQDGTKIATTLVLPYQVTGLNPSTIYNFAIKSIDTSGNVSDLSNSVALMTGPDTITEVTKSNVDSFNTSSSNALANLKTKLKSEANAEKQKELKKQIQDEFANFMLKSGKFIATPTISGNTVTFDTARLLFDGNYVFGKISDLKNSLKPEVEEERLTTAIHVDLGTVNVSNVNLKLSKELFAGLRDQNIQTVNVTVNGMTLSIPTANINADVTFSLIKQTVANYLADKSTTFKNNMNKYSSMVYSDVYTLKVSSNLPEGTVFPVKLKIPAPPAADLELLTLIKVVDGNRKTIPAVVSNGFAEKEISLINNVSDSFALLYNKVTFKDLGPVAKWAGREIEVMASKGVMDGRGNQIFDPRAYTTRAEFSKMLTLAFDLVDEKATVTYKDLVNNKNKWYYVYVASAAKYGIVTGRSNGNFDPNMNMTREEMAAMIARTLKALEKRSIVDNPTQVLNQFKDGTKVAPFAQEPIASLVNLGILKGSNGNFIPRGKATRAETAVASYRLFQLNNIDLD